jgi:hypothetical protein
MQDYSNRIAIMCEELITFYNDTTDGNFELLSVEHGTHNKDYMEFFKLDHPNRLDLTIREIARDLVKNEEIDGVMYTMLYTDIIDLDLFLKLVKENEDYTDVIFWNSIKRALLRFESITEELELYLRLNY